MDENRRRSIRVARNRRMGRPGVEGENVASASSDSPHRRGRQGDHVLDGYARRTDRASSTPTTPRSSRRASSSCPAAAPVAREPRRRRRRRAHRPVQPPSPSAGITTRSSPQPSTDGRIARLASRPRVPAVGEFFLCALAAAPRPVPHTPTRVSRPRAMAGKIQRQKLAKGGHRGRHGLLGSPRRGRVRARCREKLSTEIETRITPSARDCALRWRRWRRRRRRWAGTSNAAEAKAKAKTLKNLSVDAAERKHERRGQKVDYCNDT